MSQLEMTDLRALVANAAKSEQTRTAPAPAKRQTISQARRDLVLTMMQERYPAEVVAERYPAIDWDGMSVADFKDRLNRLRNISTLVSKTASKPATVQHGRQDLAPGRYTVVFEDESYLTLRITLQSDDSDFKPGELIVSKLVGPNNDNDYLRVGHVAASGVRLWRNHKNDARLAEAVAVLVGDPIAAVKAYALVSGRCGYCNLTLTTPASIDAGCGKDCADKHGIPHAG